MSKADPVVPSFMPHPCADLFPAMDEETFKALVADIKENGQREPIIVDQENRIVDGLNRYRACIELDLRPKFERRTLSDVEALNICISLNFHRRHLEAPVRAALAAEIATRKRGGNQPANSPDVPTQAEAAKLMHTHERAVRSAVKIKRHDPRLHEELKAGKISLHAAEQKVNEQLTTAGIRRTKKSKARPRLAAPHGDDDVAAIPAVYAPLFAELDALPGNLADHPLSPHHAGELAGLLTKAVAQIERT